MPKAKWGEWSSSPGRMEQLRLFDCCSEPSCSKQLVLIGRLRSIAIHLTILSSFSSNHGPISSCHSLIHQAMINRPTIVRVGERRKGFRRFPGSAGRKYNSWNRWNSSPRQPRHPRWVHHRNPQAAQCMLAADAAELVLTAGVDDTLASPMRISTCPLDRIASQDVIVRRRGESPSIL